MTEPAVLTGPQRIIRRVIAERRAGAPDEMIAEYAITEALHLLTGHDGPAADCTRCHQATARAVHDVRDPDDMTGASIVIQPRAELDPTVVAEAAAQVTAFLDALDQHLADYPTAVREAGYIATPTWADVALTAPMLRALTAHAYATGAPCDGQNCEQGGAAHCHRCAEVEADKLLAERDQLREGWRRACALLADAAGHKPPDCPRCFDRGYVPDWSRGLSAEHGEPGEKPCPDCQCDAVARETAERTPTGESIEP